MGKLKAAGIISFFQTLVKIEHICVNNVIFGGCRKGVSALHCAVTNGHVAMLRLLLESGANANIRGQTYQRTPVFMAGEAGNEEMVSLLIQYGTKLNLIDQYGMKTIH